MATTEEYASLSVNAGNSNAALPSGWELIGRSPDTGSGFDGAAYKKIENGVVTEVVVAYDGTSLERGDLAADLAILNGNTPSQFKEALAYYDQITSPYSSSGVPVSVTGHSLGGAEAQYVAGKTGVYGETFGAPGIKQLAGIGDLPGNNVVNHVRANDVIGWFGDHVGTTNLLAPNLFPFLTPVNPVLGLFAMSIWAHLGETYRGYFTTAASSPVSPIILDLDGDGVETIGVTAGAYFDHDGNGFAESTGWVGADDGLLVWDRNGDGRINDGKELFGSETLLSDGTKAANGYAALSELDTNTDGKVDASDAAFASLKVWQDLDGDGYSSASELKTLAELNIQSLNTGSTSSTYTDPAGNAHKLTGTFTKTDGSTGATADVWFQTDTLYTIQEEYLTVSADVAALPDLRGYGNVYDLQQAMAWDVVVS